jgi:glycosyltransferase involved in cell wall biosynthesis
MPVRIAWIGPTPSTDGGAPYVATQLLRELARAGAQVDCFLAITPDEIPPVLRRQQGLRFVLRPSAWRWGRWYNRTPMLALLSGSLFRLHAHYALAQTIAERHAQVPYDVVYQFSQSELGGLRRFREALPPIVVHPSTHAGGELAWYKRESGLVRRCEPLPRRMVARGMLTFRAAVQRRQVPQADRVLGVSRRFTEHLATDYGIPAERLGVVVNPIDLDRFRPGDGWDSAAPLTLLFVSRISVRKGVDLVVGLSHRLADLEGQVRILVVGGPTTWSDYRTLLSELNPSIATYAGEIRPESLSDLYREAAALLQPSLYEPFALTVGEALASGTPVVASEEVGAAEDADRRVCFAFPNGDEDAFERSVRGMVAAVGSGERAQLSELARAEAERLFSPATVAATLLGELERARSLTGRRR